MKQRKVVSWLHVDDLEEYVRKNGESGVTLDAVLDVKIDTPEEDNDEKYLSLLFEDLLTVSIPLGQIKSAINELEKYQEVMVNMSGAATSERTIREALWERVFDLKHALDAIEHIGFSDIDLLEDDLGEWDQSDSGHANGMIESAYMILDRIKNELEDVLGDSDLGGSED